MNIKKVFPFLAAILVTIFLCFAVFALLLRPQALEIGTVDLNTVADGEYIGVCQNKILATFTSDTVLKAIENALK